MRDEKLKKEIRQTRRLLAKAYRDAERELTPEVIARIDALDDELYYKMWNYKF